MICFTCLLPKTNKCQNARVDLCFGRSTFSPNDAERSATSNNIDSFQFEFLMWLWKKCFLNLPTILALGWWEIARLHFFDVFLVLHKSELFVPRQIYYPKDPRPLQNKNTLSNHIESCRFGYFMLRRKNVKLEQMFFDLIKILVSGVVEDYDFRISGLAFC